MNYIIFCFISSWHYSYSLVWSQFFIFHCLYLLQVAVQVKPVYTPPQLIPIGKETITYIATDRSGNQANCSFTVTVIGEFIALQKASAQTMYAAYGLARLIWETDGTSRERFEDFVADMSHSDAPWWSYCLSVGVLSLEEFIGRELGSSDCLRRSHKKIC